MTNRLAAMALVVVATVIAACSTPPAATTSPSAVPTATPAIAITTSPVANAMCMDALLTGTLARDARTGFGVTASDGQQMAVEWPFGYSARNDGGRLALLDETGTVVAREGDEIGVGGGFGNVMWHACGPVSLAQGS